MVLHNNNSNVQEGNVVVTSGNSPTTTKLAQERDHTNNVIVAVAEEEEKNNNNSNHSDTFDELTHKIQQQLLIERETVAEKAATVVASGTCIAAAHYQYLNLDYCSISKPSTISTSATSSTATNRRSRSTGGGISIRDPNFDIHMIQNSIPTLLDVLELWDQLVHLLHKNNNIFIQYKHNIERAFRAVQSTTTLYGTMICTLLNLLIQSVTEFIRRNHDMAIECRFVTLLEIVLSYDNPRWEPSADIIAIWTRLLQRIAINITPINFRRMAYRVLVSLSWVPSSKGLLTACSFDETKQVRVYNKDQIRSQMSKITNRGQFVPLPRHDPVNQLLDRLKDETDVCVAITSDQEGMGKTTLAGLVASHPSIVAAFHVVWIDIKQTNLTFDLYITYMKEICKQLQCAEPEWPVSLQRFEEAAIKRLREIASMKIAKTIMSDIIMTQIDKAVLLVLDDVQNSDVLQWFQLTTHQSIIITTPHSNLDGVDWTLDLLPMSSEEAVELFLKESGLPEEHILGKTVELHSILNECGCHPLTIRTVARWFVLRQVTSGMIQAMEEILDDLQALAQTRAEEKYQMNDIGDTNEVIFDILSLMMGPIRNNEAHTQSVLFVICFSAMVVVFPDVAPLDSVILLWEQVLKKEVLATDEIGTSLSWKELSRYIWLIAEGLTHMGVISVVDVDGVYIVEIHHNIFKEFGTLIARELEVKETFHHTAVDWHKCYVTGYLSKKSQGSEANHDDAWKYNLEKLPSHMLHAHMISTTKVVLCQREFFYARIAVLGWSRAIEVQIQDCVQLQHRIENSSNSGDESETLASQVFSRSSALIKGFDLKQSNLNEEEYLEATAKAQYLLGFALTEIGYFKDALIYLQIAESTPHESKTLKTKIVYATCWCYLSLNQTSEAKRKIESIELALSQDKVWLNKEILQLKAAVLLGACNYRASKILMEDLLAALKDDEANNTIELPMILEKLGRIYYLTGESALAKETFTNCINRKNALGEVSRALSSTLSILGDINVELKLFNEAKENYNVAIQALKKLRCNEQHLDYRFITGKLQYLEGNVAQCYASFELVRRTSKATPLKVYDQSAYDLRYIARIYDELGYHTETISVLLESLTLTEKRQLSLERAKSMKAIGEWYLKNGRGSDALINFQKAREIQMSKFGTYKDSIDTTNRIGSAHMALGAIEEAIAVYMKNYESAIRTTPDDIESIVNTLFCLGEAYISNGNNLEGLNWFTQCLAHLVSATRRDRPKIARALQTLGRLSAFFKDYDKALEFLTEALEIRRDYYDVASLIEILMDLGKLYRLRKDFDKAALYLLEAITAANSNSPCDDVRLLDIKLELGYVYRLNFQLDMANKVYTECISGLKSTDNMYGTILMILGHIKFAQGNYSGAVIDYDVALTNQTNKYGTDDIRTLMVMRSLGIANFFAGNLKIAYDHFQSFLTEQGKMTTNTIFWNVDIVYAQILMGDILFMHDSTAAQKHWNQAKDDATSNKNGTIPKWIISMIEQRFGDGNDRLVNVVDIVGHQNNYEIEIRMILLNEEDCSENNKNKQNRI